MKTGIGGLCKIFLAAFLAFGFMGCIFSPGLYKGREYNKFLNYNISRTDGQNKAIQEYAQGRAAYDKVTVGVTTENELTALGFKNAAYGGNRKTKEYYLFNNSICIDDLDAKIGEAIRTDKDFHSRVYKWEERGKFFTSNSLAHYGYFNRSYFEAAGWFIAFFAIDKNGIVIGKDWDGREIEFVVVKNKRKLGFLEKFFDSLGDVFESPKISIP